MKEQGSKISTVLLSGTISDLKRSRQSHDFVLTQMQHREIGATAIAASAMGMGAAGIGLISMAGNTDEEADWVQFALDGKQMEGWLWTMPMRDGDKVEVVAEQIGENRYVAYAVKRKSDNLLAVYPHATAGAKVHFRRSAKIWLWCFMLSYLFMPIFILIHVGWHAFLRSDLRIALFFGFLIWMGVSAMMAIRISWKFMGFVRIAELIFTTFNWIDVKNIDLRKVSQKNRRTDTSRDFGNRYFRYGE